MLKQIRILWGILLILVLFCSCAGPVQSEQTEATETKQEVTESQPETTDKVQLPEVVEYPVIEGFLTQEDLYANRPCRIQLKVVRDHEDLFYEGVYDLHIEIDMGTKVLTKELTSCVNAIVLKNNYYFADVDGDGTAEILVHYDTGGCGGYGSWLSWVLKVENDDIGILFQNDDDFDTGFDSRFLEGYQMEVTNSITGYSLVFDVKKGHQNYIDECTQLPDGKIWLDRFYSFEPKDVDDDGISEILCKQYTSIFSHNDYTGTACSMLKFNKETQTFQVADAWYEPYIEEESPQIDFLAVK